MKRLLTFVVIAVICLSLSACDPNRYTVDREKLNDVIGVELIEYENSSQREFFSWAPDQFDKLVPFVPHNVTILESLPTEKISDFLDDFSEKEILHTYYAYDSPKDVCIKLNYENGNFLIVWANYKDDSFYGYIGEYSADGAVISFWGCFSSISYYTDLVNNYFNYDLE